MTPLRGLGRVRGVLLVAVLLASVVGVGPAGAQVSPPDPVLLSNLHHTDLGRSGFGAQARLVAQAFTTGAGEHGFSATGLSVGLFGLYRFPGSAVASQGRVSLRADDGGLPGRELFGADVSLPAQTSSSDRSLLASADFGQEVVLAAGTKYWVVIGQTTAVSGWWGYASAAAGLGSDSLSGWSLSGGLREKSTTGAWSAEYTTDKPHLRFVLAGSERSPARVEPAGGDFAGDGSTLGFVDVDGEASGTLSSRNDVDAFELRTEPGRRYRLEATFGGEAAPAAGPGWIQLTDSSGQTLPGAGVNWSDYRYPDGRAYLDFMVDAGRRLDPPKWHDAESWIPQSGVYVQVHPDAYRGSGDSNHDGAYTLTLTDITGTIKMVGNMNKFWLGGDGTGTDYGYNQWEMRWGNNQAEAFAGQFTTGNLTEGFELDRVETYISGIPDGTTPKVNVLVRSDNSGDPGGVHCTLVNPAGYQNTNDGFSFPTDFFAPAAGCTLAGNTKYWVSFGAGDFSTRFSVAIVDTADGDANMRPARPKVWAWSGNASRLTFSRSSWVPASSDTRAIQFDIIAKPKLAATHKDLNPQPRLVGGL